MSRRAAGGTGLLLAAALGATLAAAPCPAPADDDAAEVRRLHERGEIRSLDAILARARRRFPEARLLEAELLRHRDRLVYEVELIDADGVVRELFFDARSGEPTEPVPEEHESH